MKTLLCSLALAAVAATVATPAAAQFAKSEDAIKYRQGALFVMGQHFSRVGAMANGRVPFDAKVAQENADIVAAMARLPWAAFGPGTEGGKAQPAIWKEQPKFKEHADKLTAEADKLAAATKTGDLAAVKAAFGNAAGSCKACHDAYRAR
jgi:cytochrome c556